MISLSLHIIAFYFIPALAQVRTNSSPTEIGFGVGVVTANPFAAGSAG